MIDPIWLLLTAAFAVGALCGVAWVEGRVAAARQDGHATGMREGYTQGRADAITVAKQQLAREMGHETTPVQSVREAILRANEEMSNHAD